MPGLTGLASLKAMVYFWTIYWSGVYGIDPAFALAVAHVESRTAHQEFRVGLLCHKWYGPFNIEKGFKKRWPDIDTIQGNCRAGVRALRGSNPRRVLQRYNAAFNEGYYRAIMAARRKYQTKLAGRGK